MPHSTPAHPPAARPRPLAPSIVVGALVAGLVIAPSAAAAAAAPSPDGAGADGTIAFVSDATGNDEIVIVDPVTGAQRRLTDSPGFDRAPSWSPDGTWLVFNSRREPHPDRPQIYRLDLGTGEAARIGVAPDEQQRAAVADDGEVLAHQGAFLATAFNLVSLATEPSTPITASTDPAIWNAAPAPRPGTDEVLFQSNQHLEAPSGPFPQRLHLLDRGSGEISRIEPAGLPADGSVDGPRWNADGTAFVVSASDGDSTRLYLVEASGDPAGWTATAITDGTADVGSPALSPDGTRVAFQEWIPGDDPDGEEDVAVVRILDLASGEARTIAEGRTPVWTATAWFAGAEQPGAVDPAAPGLPATGAVPDTGAIGLAAALATAGVIAIAGAALRPARRTGRPRG